MKGPYSYVRHPQYVAFLVVMIGFLLQWPTLATLLMFPVLAWSYVRLAQTEERRMKKEFGCCWQAYAHGRPAFLPRLSRVAAVLGGLVKMDRPGWTGPEQKARLGTPATHGRTESDPSIHSDKRPKDEMGMDFRPRPLSEASMQRMGIGIERRWR